MLLRLKFRFAAPGTSLAGIDSVSFRTLWRRRRKLARIRRHPGYTYSYSLLMGYDEPARWRGREYGQTPESALFRWHPELAGWL